MIMMNTEVGYIAQYRNSKIYAYKLIFMYTQVKKVILLHTYNTYNTKFINKKEMHLIQLIIEDIGSLLTA